MREYLTLCECGRALQVFSTGAIDMTQIARSAVFIGFDSLCRQHGLNPQSLLRRCGLDPVVLRRRDLYVPYARFAQALNLAASEASLPSFGLQLIEYHDYLVLGPFGLLLAQADNFAEVLKLTQQYVHLHAQGIALRAELESDQLRVEYHLQLQGSVDLRQLRELGLGVVQRSMATLFQADWQPRQLLISHACLGEPADYARVFNCPVQFERPFSAFIVDADTLGLRPVEQRSQLKSHLIEEFAESQQLPADIPGQIHYILQSILSTGEASLGVVARLLDQHPRSLQQALQAQGQSFRRILDQVRYAEAKQQLRLSTKSITDLALNLGYADETAFSRAFKRWSGQAPQHWRKQAVAARSQ